MGNTTITLTELTRERLDAYRHQDHDNMSEVINDILDWLPKPVDIAGDGCTNCDAPPHNPRARFGELEGVIQHFVVDRSDTGDEVVTGTNYFCSHECLAEFQQDAQAQVPREPDEIEVGGKDEFVSTFSDGRMFLTEDEFSVGLDVPGAFSGESASGEYDYLGEPVYVWNQGEVVQEGIIEEIVHEESHTALVLGHDLPTTRLNHPEEETREAYLSEWRVGTHTECDKRVQTRRGTAIEGDCPHCGETFNDDVFAEHDVSAEYSP